MELFFISLVFIGIGTVNAETGFEVDDMRLNQEQKNWLKAGLLDGELDGLIVNEDTKIVNEDNYHGNALRDPNLLWPNNTVYFSFDSTVTRYQKNRLRSVLSGLQQKLSSCLIFKEKNDGNRVIVGTGARGCWSDVGYQGGPQKLNLASGCWGIGTIEHEFLHAIGIYHHQSRSDRKHHVKIIWNNIQDGEEHNFNSYSKATISHHGLPYDYNSVMHYGKSYFRKEKGQLTIQTKDPSKQNVIGNRKGVTSGDIELVRRTYGCNGIWTPGKNVDCWPGCGQKGGFCPSVCGEDGWCCRKGFTGDNCPDQARSVSTARHHSCVIIDSDIKNDYYLIQSSGGAAQQQASRMGRYTYTGETVRGYPVYENDDQYLFVSSDGYWTVGPDTSLTGGGLYHPDGQPTPSSAPLHGWKYANNNGWHDDSTLTVTHINGDKTQPGSGCFPGVSEVMLEGGEKKSMEDLRVGDVIVSMDSGKLVSTMVLGFLDKRVNQTTEYLNLNIEDGRTLFISPTHAIFIKGDDNSIKSVLAKEVKPGDVVVTEKGFSQVKLVTVVVKSGAYVPLTDAGTLIVDGVLVSCYTNAPHWLAHIVLAPLRWWPTLLLDTEESQHSEGVKAYPWMVKNLGNFLGLADVSVPNDKIESGDFPKREMSSPRLTPNKMDKYEL